MTFNLRRTDRVAFVVPYFGKLPNYFNLWLKSAKNNPRVDVFFFTDNEEPQGLSKNIYWVKTTFADVKARAQSLIEFPIVLDQPYKLVDYKPLYGAMFQDYISDYDWWAYGDIDTIWGNLELILKRTEGKYDKMLDLGHLTLIRNSERMNSLWHNKVEGAWTYQDALKSDLIYHFDEGGGISFIAKKSECKIYSEVPGKMNFADVCPFNPQFEIAYDSGDGKLPHVFTWRNGVLTGYWAKADKVDCKEYAYVHLQKNKMQVAVGDVASDNVFLIVPNKFLPLEKKDIISRFIESQHSEEVREVKNEQFVKHFINYLKFLKFKTKGRKRDIPLNGNEAYFGTEEAKY
ncbi:DUF6625 family protein [Lactobacillus delbrueckii]|uniref:DUF6625 family protein n=1 Tax=Lactobacillus delbrueckii TaxID=1584 RepID=UPI0022EBDA38|nr:DUF6625 family protein [Lactobacillus delbrueckii]